MSYYGTNVSNSSSAYAQTGYSAQARFHYVVSDSVNDAGDLTAEEIKKLNKSMRVHEESLSLLGQ